MGARLFLLSESPVSLVLDVLTGLKNGAINLVTLPVTISQWWQLETLKEKMTALTLAGQSLEFLYIMMALLIASWFVLLLMFQQVLIIVMGQVFRGNELMFAPFGMQLANNELQWLSGQLKFYNAILIALASAYTFIEGGHVRVDLVYGSLSYKAKRFMDFLGSVFFMLPTTILIWWFAWPIATNSAFSQRPLNIFSEKASWRGFKWESSGTAEFTWVWAFKAIILLFAALLFIQAVAFMLRNLWGLLEPDVESHPKVDQDVIDELAQKASVDGVTNTAQEVDINLATRSN